MCDAPVSREEFEELKAAFEEEREQRRALEERVDELESENEQLRERVEDVEDAPDVEMRGEGETNEIADLWIDGLPVGKGVENQIQKVKDLDKRVFEIEGEIENTPDDAVGVEDTEDLIPIQRIAMTPDENLDPRERRAKFLWRDFEDYSRKTPSGRVISSPEAKRVLSAAEPEDGAATIDTTMVKRVFKVIAGGTRGAASKKKIDGTWRMKVPNNWKELAAQEDASAAVSAASGGT